MMEHFLRDGLRVRGDFEGNSDHALPGSKSVRAIYGAN